MHSQTSFCPSAIQISNLHKYFEQFKSTSESDPRFLKILNKLQSNIQEVAAFLSIPLAQIKVKQSVEDYTAEELNILKLTKNIVAAGAYFSNLACENPLIEAIQLVLGTWKKSLLSCAARRPAAVLPLAKKARLVSTTLPFSFNNLPDELVTAICSYANWMAPLNLLRTNKRLYTIYQANHSPFMVGMRLVNQALNQCTKLVRYTNFSDFNPLWLGRSINGVSEYPELPTDFVFELKNKTFFEGIKQETISLESFLTYVEHLCTFTTPGNRDCFLTKLLHCLFPEAVLEYNVPIATNFENFAFQLKQEGLPAMIDYKTYLLIGFIIKLDISIVSADLNWLAWQLLANKIDLAIAPYKKALLARLLELGSHRAYFPLSHSLQTEIILTRASRSKFSNLEIELLDLNQALMQAYTSFPEVKLRAFTEIFQRHKLGEWTLNLNQIEQILANWRGRDIVLLNNHAYLNDADLFDSYIITYCKMAEPLLQILLNESNASNQNEIRPLVYKVCKDLEELFKIDLGMYEDEECNSLHGSVIPCNFGIVLQLIDKFDRTKSADLFESLKAILAHASKLGFSSREKKNLSLNILAWQSEQIYTFLNDICQDDEKWCAWVIEQYAQYNATLALQLSYEYCKTPRTVLNLIAKILPKLEVPIASQAAEKAGEFLKSALEIHAEIDPTALILSIGPVNLELAMRLALNLKDPNKKSLCCLKIIQANLPRFSQVSFYQDPSIVEAVTQATTASQRLINQQVFNFLFKLSNSLEDFRHAIGNSIFLLGPVDSYFHPQFWINEIESLYSALVAAGMLSQDLLEVVQEESASLPDTNDRKIEIYCWLIRKANQLMDKDMMYAAERTWIDRS